MQSAKNDPEYFDNEVHHVVLLIHGIRDWGGWYSKVDSVLKSSRVHVTGISYDFFNALLFLIGAYRKPMGVLKQEYETAKRM